METEMEKYGQQKADTFRLQMKQYQYHLKALNLFKLVTVAASIAIGMIAEDW